MIGRPQARAIVVAASAAAWALSEPSPAIAAPLLRSADIRLIVTSPTSCEVTMALTLEGATEVDHRIEAFEEARSAGGADGVNGVELLALAHAQQIARRAIGRTYSLVLRPEQPSYELRYRVRQPESRRDRCPIWLPAVPTDGQPRSVRLQIALPSQAVPGTSLPTFAWTGSHGSTMLGHVPAFVLVRYGSAGESRGWDVAQAMDATAIAVFAGGSLVWAWRRRRR